jgi:hypothetical protein
MTSELERLGPGPGSPGGGAVDSVDGQTGAVDLTNSYQAKDADLTAIAGLSASNDDFVQRKSGAWSNRTVAQVKTDLGITDEDLQDLIGAMVSGDTETNITVTYDDTNGKLNFVVSTAPPTERSITAAGSTAAYTDASSQTQPRPRSRSDFLQRHLVNCRSSSRTSDRTC